MSGDGFDALVMNDTNGEIKAKFGWVRTCSLARSICWAGSHPVHISVDGWGASYSADTVGADRIVAAACRVVSVWRI